MKIAITGATSGLGRATTEHLLREGHSVIALIRDVGKGSRIRDELRGDAIKGKLQLIEADLSSLASIEKATMEMQSDVSPDALICNAGLQIVDGIQKSVDGYELTMAVNILGHQRLILGLLDVLPEEGRVVLLGSETHRGGLGTFGFPSPRWKDPRKLYQPDDDASTSSQAGRVRYANSKLATVYLTTEINRRFADRGLFANTFDPGLMPETGLDRQYPGVVQTTYRWSTALMVRMPGDKRVRESASDLAWLATSSETQGWSDKYVSGTKVQEPSGLSKAADNAEELWNVGEFLIGALPRNRPKTKNSNNRQETGATITATNCASANRGKKKQPLVGVGTWTIWSPRWDSNPGPTD